MVRLEKRLECVDKWKYRTVWVTKSEATVCSDFKNYGSLLLRELLGLLGLLLGRTTQLSYTRKTVEEEY